MTRSTLLSLVLFTYVGSKFAASGAAGIPVTGDPVPELAAFDAAMTNFMRANSIKGGALAVMKDGRLVLKHGYGWSDKAQIVPFHPDSRARVASNGKTFTAVAIKHLIERGVIATNTPAIQFAGIQPYNGQWGDARWQEIHVLQFLAHSSGWDNDIPDCFSFSSSLGLDHAGTMREMISYVLTRRLKFQPGARIAYSSPSYGVLAQVIEKASSIDYFTYISRHVARTWGIRDIGLQRTEPKLRPEDEPYYDDGGAPPGRNNADFPTEELLPIPDGGGDYLYESALGPGGLIANVEALVTLAQVCLISHGDAFQPTAGIPTFMNGDRRRWRHLGQIGAQLGGEEGANSFNFQNTNGVDFAFFLNRSVDHQALASTLKRLAETPIHWPGDNAPEITLASDSFTVSEEEGDFGIGVRRTGDSRDPVSVVYVIEDETNGRREEAFAEMGLAGTNLGGLLPFAPDEIAQTIKLRTRNNDQPDGTRRFTLRLFDPGNSAIPTQPPGLGISTATIIIEDDEEPQLPPQIQITSPTNGAAVSGNLLVTVNVIPATRPLSKVEYFAGPTLLGEENKPPYTFTWKPRFLSGRFLLSARVTDDRGLATPSSPVLVVLGDGPSSDPGHGLLREFWTRRPRSDLAALTNYVHFPRRPTGWQLIANFQTPYNWGEYYGARLRGYVVPPVTGEYVFWIAANDTAKLWLSTDATAEHKQLIATVATVTAPLPWDTAPKSQPVLLQAGRRYYVEALHKQGITGEHLAVGWQLPGGELERPIPGKRLLPFNTEPQPVLTAPTFKATTARIGMTLSVTRDHVIETSTDLRNWLPIRNTTTTGIMLEFQDTDAPQFPQRFYRSRLLQP